MQYEALIEVHTPDYPITIHLISHRPSKVDFCWFTGHMESVKKKQISPFEKQITEYPQFLCVCVCVVKNTELYMWKET